MIKLRLKRYGRKHRPIYRIVAIDAKVRREGQALYEFGLYDPQKEQTYFDEIIAKSLLQRGAKPTNRVNFILRKSLLIRNFLDKLPYTDPNPS